MVHPLEKFGLAGFFVAVLLPIEVGWPIWWTAMSIVIIAGALLLTGQTIRHRAILKRLKQ